jgi:hypothetical protein
MTASATTPGDSSGGSTAAQSTDATGGTPIEGSCTNVRECRLHSDCCTCEAIALDQVPEPCGLTCERTACEDWGITELLCSHTCLVRLVDCDPALVNCADAPPVCAEGFAPSVEQRCWTRHCVPVDLCTPA